MLVPGAGAGAVSWLRTWWRQVAGAGCRVPVLGGLLGAGAGAGAVSWLYARNIIYGVAASRAVLFAHILLYV